MTVLVLWADKGCSILRVRALASGTVTAMPRAYSRRSRPFLADLGWRHSVDLREAESAGQDTLGEVARIEAAASDTVVPILQNFQAGINRLTDNLGRQRVGPVS